MLLGAFAVVAVAALVQSSTPSLTPTGTVAFLRRAPANQVGAVTGVVGAAGGLGGFGPPLVMGGVYGSLGSYAVGLVALSAVAAGMLVLTATVVRKPAMS